MEQKQEQEHINAQQIIAAYRLPISIIDEFNTVADAAYANISKVAMSLGLTTVADGVLIHPDLGPTGFIAPREELRAEALIAGAKIEFHNVQENVWVFAPGEDGQVKAFELFSRYMDGVAPFIPDTQLHMWMSRLVVGAAPVQFAFMLEAQDDSQDIVLMFTSEVPVEVQERIAELGGVPREFPEGSTVQNFGNMMVARNTELLDASDGDTLTVGDDVDVIVTRAEDRTDK